MNFYLAPAKIYLIFRYIRFKPAFYFLAFAVIKARFNSASNTKERPHFLWSINFLLSHRTDCFYGQNCVLEVHKIRTLPEY